MIYWYFGIGIVYCLIWTGVSNFGFRKLKKENGIAKRFNDKTFWLNVFSYTIIWPLDIVWKIIMFTKLIRDQNFMDYLFESTTEDTPE